MDNIPSWQPFKSPVNEYVNEWVKEWMNEYSRARAVSIDTTTEIQPPSNTSGGRVGLKMETEMD